MSRAVSILILLLWLGQFTAKAQAPFAPRDTTKHNRLYLLAAGSAVIYAGAFIGLSEAWYSEQEQTSFHFFNDWHEWKQMDKAGHLLTSFHESRFGVDAMRWAGAKEKPAVLIGGMLGFILQSPIEILDGRAADYGASWYDLGANAAGSAMVIGQQLAWKELRITPKFSYHHTRYAAYRPHLLGHSTAERALKDYNGQTYWLTFNVSKFLPEASRYPKWLGVAFGYGAQQMVYNDPKSNAALGLNAYRQYYFSPDLTFSYLKPRSKVLKIALYLLDIVHLPLPALEYSQRNGFKAHALYF
jgi:hypothetical protein